MGSWGRRIAFWLIGLPLAVIAVLFAISNRAPVVFALWPLPFELEAPRFLPVLIAAGIGFLVGGFTAWLGGAHNRRRARVRSAEAAEARREVLQLSQKLVELQQTRSGEAQSSMPSVRNRD
ncbi:MAG: LapA family protein [Alphaproteobacteria bacterium]